jgi:hypothetical protein
VHEVCKELGIEFNGHITQYEANLIAVDIHLQSLFTQTLLSFAKQVEFVLVVPTEIGLTFPK